MKKSRRRDIEVFGLSFLDCICCGFGAIILLLVLVKFFEPINLEKTTVDLEGVLARLEEELFEIVGDTKILNRELTAKEEQISDNKEKIARLRAELTAIQGEFDATKDDATISSEIEGRLARAKQRLTEEMARLPSPQRKPDDYTVGGIPVDSEYIIFVIDTSGSMFNYSWGLAQQKLAETLELYPRVKGIQVMNDMGDYMFSRYTNKWIPDSPARRNAIIKRMATWNPFSNSSPVEGITRAISTFYAPDKKISIYVFGDEFTGTSIEAVIQAVDRINKADAKGNRLVRIHAVGFPIQFSRADSLRSTGTRFAVLMRTLCHRNGGTFVGLNNPRT